MLSAIRDAHILLNITFTDERENAGPTQVHAWAFKNEKYLRLSMAKLVYKGWTIQVNIVGNK